MGQAYAKTEYKARYGDEKGGRVVGKGREKCEQKQASDGEINNYRC